MNKLRIALIGLGDIAQKAYLPIIANHEEIEPILCTRNPKTLARLQAQYRIDESYTDVPQLIANKPDAVMIHTSTASHFSIAKQSLTAGIATFIDKPLSINLAECEALVSLAKAKNTPLYVGFNRRFSPLIAPLVQKDIVHARWQKNRVALPSTIRETVFNDFIHVVDGLLFLAKSPTESLLNNLQVNAYMQGGLLANVHIQFNHNNALFEGSMNRISGITEEKLEVFLPDEKYHIESLVRGSHFHAGNETPIGFNDWQSYLFSRGFEQMLTDWFNDIKQGRTNDLRLQQIIASHRLCESIVAKIEQ